ncbi:hypothetical protein [Nocardia sp. NPDC051570]|uniref:hypothetical protein n=1 Tax=Nocardia sp. NPDC051570 TaxID=3364324 RepID=UPI0037A9DE60
MDMSALRRFSEPRPVLVDPRRLLVVPLQVQEQPSIGVQAASFEACGDGQWLAAQLYAWARLRASWPQPPSVGYLWYGQIAVTFETRNRQEQHDFWQWVPADAVRPIPSSDAPCRQSRAAAGGRPVQ